MYGRVHFPYFFAEAQLYAKRPILKSSVRIRRDTGLRGVKSARFTSTRCRHYVQLARKHFGVNARKIATFRMPNVELRNSAGAAEVR